MKFFKFFKKFVKLPDWQNSFGSNPSIRDNPNEILGWQWFENGYEHFDDVFFFGKFLFQQKVFVVQNNFRVHVFHENPKGFGMAMDFFIPLKIWSNGQFDAQSGSCDGLNMRNQVQFWKLMNVSV